MSDDEGCEGCEGCGGPRFFVRTTEPHRWREDETMELVDRKTGDAYSNIGEWDWFPELANEVNEEVVALENKIEVIGRLLEENGCDCDCGHDRGYHEEDCEICLACRISEVLQPPRPKRIWPWPTPVEVVDE